VVASAAWLVAQPVHVVAARAVRGVVRRNSLRLDRGFIGPEE